MQPDGFEVKEKEQYRHCWINPEGVYQVDIYRRSEGADTKLVLAESYVPERMRQALNFIPFQFFGVEHLSPQVSRSPIKGLVDVNYTNYRHSADYEHGLYLTSLPTLVVSGHASDDDIQAIGSMAALVMPEPEAKAYFLEYQGQGLEPHERAMESDKKRMATLGARLLEEMPTTQETLGQVQIRHAGDMGTLKNLVGKASDGLSAMAQIHHWWMGATESIADERYRIDLNTDLSAMRLSSQEQLALVQSWQAGAISHETLLHNYKQGEILPHDVSIEDEMRKIETETPTGLLFGDDGVGDE